ncbi:unnamed protein product [Trichogramma brassicae]|uniref:Uncharacterized protein n=1 Tax=Trichogramma brassicae TaxID=86971 RepID=A0A6H5IJX4_9HYME|nr:unnamed protein product [Trichogramma brassicae]
MRSKQFDERHRIDDDGRYRGYDSKLELVSGILSIIERLERKGYELNQSDALTIMNLFVKYKSFQKLEDIDDCWRSEKEFASRMKEHIIFPLIQNTGEYERELNETMMTPRFSTYDLVQLQPQEVSQIFTYKDFYKMDPGCSLREDTTIPIADQVL